MQVDSCAHCSQAGFHADAYSRTRRLSVHACSRWDHEQSCCDLTQLACDLNTLQCMSIFSSVSISVYNPRAGIGHEIALPAADIIRPSPWLPVSSLVLTCRLMPIVWRPYRLRILGTGHDFLCGDHTGCGYQAQDITSYGSTGA